MQSLFSPANAPSWLREFRLSVERALSSSSNLKEYRKADLPAPGGAKRLIYVSDEAGGAVPAFSDGTNWRRVTDRAIVS